MGLSTRVNKDVMARWKPTTAGEVRALKNALEP